MRSPLALSAPARDAGRKILKTINLERFIPIHRFLSRLTAELFILLPAGSVTSVAGVASSLRTGGLTIKWGSEMKRWLWVGAMATVIAVPALSGIAGAAGANDYGCSNATLKGEYAFGVLTVASATGPGVVAGIKVFDGRGNLTQRDYIGNSVPAEFAPPGQEQGTYIVNPDCTGSMVINLNAPVSSGSTGVINILFVISNGGRHIHEVVSEFTPPGSTTGPEPTQTSADDWKVASEQEQ